MLDRAELRPRGGALLEKIRRDVTDFTPRTNLESQAYQPVVDQVAVADDARNARGQNAGPTMPGVVWFGLMLSLSVWSFRTREI